MRPHRRQPTRFPRPWDSPGKNTGVGCHFLLQWVKVKRESEVAQSFLTLSDPMDCSIPGSSAHGIFQARVLEWDAIAFSVPYATSSYIPPNHPLYPSKILTKKIQVQIHTNTHTHNLPGNFWSSLLKVTTEKSSSSVQFSHSVMLTFCDSMDWSIPDLPIHHQLLKLTQIQVHWVSDAILPSHPLLNPSPPTYNRSQHLGLFKWVSSSHQVAKVLEFQLQHQFFQWIFGSNFL